MQRTSLQRPAHHHSKTSNLQPQAKIMLRLRQALMIEEVLDLLRNHEPHSR